MKRKQCLDPDVCEHISGSYNRPHCDRYDEPIKNISNCPMYKERRQNENKQRIPNIHKEG